MSLTYDQLSISSVGKGPFKGQSSTLNTYAKMLTPRWRRKCDAELPPLAMHVTMADDLQPGMTSFQNVERPSCGIT